MINDSNSGCFKSHMKEEYFISHEMLLINETQNSDFGDNYYIQLKTGQVIPLEDDEYEKLTRWVEDNAHVIEI